MRLTQPVLGEFDLVLGLVWLRFNLLTFATEPLLLLLRTAPAPENGSLTLLILLCVSFFVAFCYLLLLFAIAF